MVAARINDVRRLTSQDLQPSALRQAHLEKQAPKAHGVTLGFTVGALGYFELKPAARKLTWSRSIDRMSSTEVPPAIANALRSAALVVLGDGKDSALGRTLELLVKTVDPAKGR